MGTPDLALKAEIARVFADNFGAYGARKVWRQLVREGIRVSDFPDVSTWAGFVSVAFVIDVYARYIVGWRVTRTADAGFVLDALDQALHAKRPVHRRGPVHDSDRGSQDLSIKYTERLAEVGIEPIGNIPPAEAEERYYATLTPQAAAAWLKPNGLRQSQGGSVPP